MICSCIPHASYSQAECMKSLVGSGWFHGWIRESRLWFDGGGLGCGFWVVLWWLTWLGWFERGWGCCGGYKHYISNIQNTSTYSYVTTTKNNMLIYLKSFDSGLAHMLCITCVIIYYLSHCLVLPLPLPRLTSVIASPSLCRCIVLPLPLPLLYLCHYLRLVFATCIDSVWHCLSVCIEHGYGYTYMAIYMAIHIAIAIYMATHMAIAIAIYMAIRIAIHIAIAIPIHGYTYSYSYICSHVYSHISIAIAMCYAYSQANIRQTLFMLH